MTGIRTRKTALALSLACLLAAWGCQDPVSETPPPDGNGGILTPGTGNPDTVKTPGTGNPGTGNPGTGNPQDTVKPPAGDTVKPPTGNPDTTKPGTGTPACAGATDWLAGKDYAVGAVVRYPANGKHYQAVNANPGYDPTVSTWFWSPYACSGGVVTPVDPPKGDTVKPDTGKPVDPGTSADGFAALLPEEVFNRFFPRRNALYTYQGLSQAVASFPGFASSGDLALRKREVAAFLGNVAHETGYLVYVEQIEQGEYCGHDWSGRCACQPGKRYFGRGPLQISWNYNYGAAGEALGAPLCQDPDLVARDARLAWGTALWFWMNSTGAGSMTCHAAMTGGGGFGATIQTINGSVECGGKRPDAVGMRQTAYKTLCRLLGIEPGDNLGC